MREISHKNGCQALGGIPLIQIVGRLSRRMVSTKPVWATEQDLFFKKKKGGGEGGEGRDSEHMSVTELRHV